MPITPPGSSFWAEPPPPPPPPPHPAADTNAINSNGKASRRDMESRSLRRPRLEQHRQVIREALGVERRRLADHDHGPADEEAVDAVAADVAEPRHHRIGDVAVAAEHCRCARSPARQR